MQRLLLGNDAKLKEAVTAKDDEKLVGCIDEGLSCSTQLLGIISNSTKGSWWVPYEFGATRQRKLPIALLLLEEITELPSYMKLAKVLRDSDDLTKWVKALDEATESRMLQKSARPPHIPRVRAYRSEHPTYT